MYSRADCAVGSRFVVIHSCKADDTFSMTDCRLSPKRLSADVNLSIRSTSEFMSGTICFARSMMDSSMDGMIIRQSTTITAIASAITIAMERFFANLSAFARVFSLFAFMNLAPSRRSK